MCLFSSCRALWPGIGSVPNEQAVMVHGSAAARHPAAAWGGRADTAT